MLGVHQGLPSDASDLFNHAKHLGADTFQVFLRNNRNMRMRTWNQYAIDNFNSKCFSSGIWSFVVHAPYAMNPGTADKEAHRRYIRMIMEDLRLLQQLAGKKYYVLHPGSANTCSYTEALNNLKILVNALKPFLGTTTLAVEFMAGRGTQLLRDVHQIRWCIDNIKGIRFCYDSCHVFAAGMDIVGTLKAYSDYIDVVHLNDCSSVKGSRLDRHANLGKGYIPLPELTSCYEYWTSLYPSKPIILETPSIGLIDDFYFLKGR